MSVENWLLDKTLAGTNWHAAQHSGMGVGTNLNLAASPNSTSSRLSSSTDTGVRAFGEEFLWQWFSSWRNTPAQIPNVFLSGDSTTAGNNISDTTYRPDVLLPILAQARGFAITATNGGHSGMSTANWLSTYLPADLGGTVPAIYVMRWGLNDPFYGISVAQTIQNIRTGLATIRATNGWDSTKVGLVLMAPNTSSDDAAGRNEAWHEAVESGLMQAARDYGAAYISPYKRLRTARNLVPTSANQWLDAALVHPNEDHSLLVVEMLRDLLFPRALADKLGAQSAITAGSGFSAPGGGSTDFASTTGNGRFVNFSGYLNGPSTTVASGWVVGTVAAQHRPVNGVFMAQASVWNGSTATSSANWQQIPVFIQSNGQIATMTATTLAVARMYFNNITIARF